MQLRCRGALVDNADSYPVAGQYAIMQKVHFLNSFML